MNKFVSIALAGLSLVLVQAAEPPKAETVLDRYVEVTGGKAAYDKIHNEVTKGTMEFVGKGIKGTISNWQAEPNRSFTVAELEGVGKVESGSDGDVFWERSAITGPRVKSGDERDEILRASIFNPHLNWRKVYDKADVAGSEMVDGDDCYKVILTPKTGNPATHFYSKKTGFLMKTSSVHKTQMGDITADGFYRDYKPVGDSGVTMPYTQINSLAGQQIAVHLDSIDFNTQFAKDLFDLPEEVKVLVRKDGAEVKKSGGSNANK